MTTKPFLFLDLEKSWREELHPRDTFGKFTAVKGGSRVVTKTGKTGVVNKVDGNRYHVNYDDGTSGRLLKDNVIHEKDHAKVAKTTKKKKATAKKAGKKQSATKAQHKANGTAKPKAVKDPTVKAPAKTSTSVRKGASVHTSTGKKGKVVGQSTDGKKWLIETEDGKKIRVNKENVTHAKDVKPAKASKKTAKPKAVAKPKATKTAKAPAKPKKQPRAKEALEAPVLKRSKDQASEAKEVKQAVPKATKAKAEQRKKENAKENAPIQEYEQSVPAGSIDEMWNTSEVQNILKTPVGERDPEQVRKIAGDITNANDKLAYSIASKRASKMGISMAKNQIGNKASKTVITQGQETGMYGDMLQSARGAMYETLLATLSGSQKPGTDIGAHVTMRMKDKLNKDLYGMLNSIPAPHEIRGAIKDMKKHETELTQQIGRTPSDEELGSYLEASSKHFREAPINQAPRWDEKSGEWKATKARIEDPAERLKMLRQYDSIQRTTSADAHIGSEGEKEVTLTDNVVDHSASPEEQYERQERQKELEGTLPNAMRQMGMSDASIKVWTMTHSGTSGNRGHMTSKEVAEHINSEGGWDGKPISEAWVRKHYSAGRKVIAQAFEDNHPAIAQLKLLKSLVFNDMVKAVYEFNLVKALHSWGFDHTVLRREFVRTASGRNLVDIKKSLDPTEYIGSYVTVDSGQVHARIVRNALPKGEELTKAFQDFEALEKALFSHKDGGNNAVNQKATEYVKKNAGKYKGIASEQAKRIKAKGGNLTWSEQLLIDNPGSAWISWGGKRILVNSSTGEVVYDSRNDSHREEQAKKHGVSTQEDKLDFHHEQEEAESKKNELMEQAKKEHAEGNYGRSQAKWAEKYGVKTKKVKNEAGKDELHFDTDEEGNLQFDHSKHRLVTDHGAQAFEESIGDLAEHIKSHKSSAVEEHHHKVVGMYGKLSDEDREHYDALNPEDRKEFIGEHLSDQEGVRDALAKAKDMMEEGTKRDDVWKEVEGDFKALGKQHGSMALQNKKRMLAFLNVLKDHDLDSSEVNSALGNQELGRAREEANKRIVPEGHYEIGNKATGESMVVKIGHRTDPTNGNFTTYVQEAFNPKTGKHFATDRDSDVDKSWGQLGKELGLPHNSAEKFIYESNKSGSDAVMTSMDDDEAKDLRKNSTLGMRDAMVHKEFSMVDQNVDKDGNVVSTTYAQDMPDGTQNVIEVGNDGYIKDPIMARLIKNRDPINSAEDLHQALQGAVGNTAWVTTHAGSDRHVGDVLGHHVKLMYDGKGAPRVVGGKYDGYRFMDSKDIPKGATDPHTGEPIKALFKNGKLVDRKFTKNNDVAMKRGNAVMYPDGNGFKKGTIRTAKEDGSFEVVNSKGQLVGQFSPKELKPAKEKGRTLADSGQAVLHLKESNAHRMDTSEAFQLPHNKSVLTRKELAENAKAEKLRDLFQQALDKAGVKNHSDEEGNLNQHLDLSDAEHDALKKILGRSKAGRDILKKFNKTSLPSTLELHVPEHLRADVQAEGVSVGADGRAEVSTAKFEHLRNVLGGLSMDNKAQDFLKDHFRRKDRTPKSVEELKKDYQPSMAQGLHANHFREQFKPDSFLMNPEQGLYGTQLEGVAHLVERGRGIAGHGMGTGKYTLEKSVA